MDKINWQNVTVKLGELTPWPRNPRKISDEQAKRLNESFDEFGQVETVAIGPDNDIYNGHQRLKVLMAKHGPDFEIEARRSSRPLTEKEREKLTIFLHKGAAGEWDIEILKREFDKNDLGDWGFSEDDLADWSDDEDTEDTSSENKPIIRDADMEALAPTDEERSIISGRTILVQFSGGKDSSAAAAWVKHFFPDSETVLLFVDMGADYTSMPLFLHNFSETVGIPLKVLRSEKTMHEAFIEKGDWPRFRGPYCHKLLHAPLDAYTKQYETSNVIVVRGGRSSERVAHTKQREARITSIGSIPGYDVFQSLYYTDKDVCEKLLIDCDLPIWSGYTTGLGRTACRICPGQTPATYYAIREKYPDVWDELLWFEVQFGPGCWPDPVDKTGHGSVIAAAEHYASKMETAK